MTRIHLTFGVLTFSILALVQAFIESGVLIIRFDEYIFRPHDILRVQIFSLMHWLLDWSKYASLPFILDIYLGPSFTDKLPLILRLIGVYQIAGVIAGTLFGLMFSILFKLRKKRAEHPNLLNLYFWIAIVFFFSFNLFSALVPTEVNGSFPLLIFLGGLLITLLFFALVRARSVHLPFRIHFNTRWSSTVLIPPVLIAAFYTFVIISSFAKTTTVVQPLYASSPKSKENPLRKPTNVVLISIDTLRADHIGCYGYSRNTTPNIDKLASEGILFKDAFSVTTWTLPAHMSMMTSLYPEASGVVTYENSLSDEHVTLAEVLSQNGFQTSGFVSGQYVNSRYGFDQGFSLYDDFSIDTRGDSSVVGTSQKLNILVDRWLSERTNKNFFLFLHYFDVHWDYDPPPPYDKLFDPDYQGSIDGRNYKRNPRVNKNMKARDLEHIVALYDAEIAFTDEYIGRFISKLKNLGIYDETLIIVTSDHGEAFFEHGKNGHSSTPYDELIHVPLIIKFPATAGYPRGITVSGQASILDIMPTVLDFLGLKSARQMEGQSLLPVISGTTTLDNRNVYFLFEKTQYGVRTDTRKFILSYDEQFSAPPSDRTHIEKFSRRYGRPWKLFYDLTIDRRETKTLYRRGDRKNRAAADRHMLSLLDWLNHQRAMYYSVPYRRSKKKMSSEEEEKEKLRAIGYFQ